MTCLFVGFGTIAQKHFFALNELVPDCIFYALRSSRTSDFSYSNVVNIYDWDEIPNNIDFAIISTPTNLHLDPLFKLVSLGVNIFIEKPISNSLNGLTEIIDIIKQKKLKTYVACNLRFLPALNFFDREILPKINKINEVSIYCGSYLPSWRPNKNYKEFYSAHAEKGGGVHLDLFHELDYAFWLFGSPISSHRFLTNSSNLEISAKDFAKFFLLYEDFPLSITLNYFRRDSKREMEVVTDEETYTVDVLNNKISDSKGKILFHNNEIKISDTYKLQMKYYIDYLNNNVKEFNTIESSYKVLNICLSNETKR